MSQENLTDLNDKIAVPKERVFDRAQGCWNCKHWDQEAAKPRWNELRQRDLTAALQIALVSPHGENDVRVENTRTMVDSLDHLVAQRMVGVCRGDGRTAKGEPVGDFTLHGLLCDRWTGKVGASVAREGRALDTLPEELTDKLDK